MAEIIDKNNFSENVLQSTLPVLVDFYSDTCMPCKMLAPVIEEIQEAFHGKLDVYKVNVNSEYELAENYGIMSIPALILFNNGDEKARHVGFLDKPALTSWLEALIAG